MATAVADPLPPPPEGLPLEDSIFPTMTPLVGSRREYGNADGVGAAARFNGPRGLTVAPSGIVYVADEYNDRVRQINPATGAVTTLGIGGAARVPAPQYIAVAPSGVIYVTCVDRNNIRQIDPATGAVTTLAGSVEGFADGVGRVARFNEPRGIAVAPSGIVYVADSLNNRIRQINPVTGAVTTLAGSVEGFADGVGAAAQFNFPDCIAVAPSGILYVTDKHSHRIRQIDPVTGAVTTLAGSVEGFADDVGAAARFCYPEYIAVAPSGILYVSDYNQAIRRIDPMTGAVTTLAVNGHNLYFWYIRGLAVAPSGVVYVTQEEDHMIYQIRLRANPGLVHMARKAIVNGTSKFGVLPENVVGDIFSYVGNTRGLGGGLHLRRADPDAAAQSEAFRARLLAERGAAAAKPVGNMNALNRRSTRSRRTNRRKTRKHSRKTHRSRK